MNICYHYARWRLPPFRNGPVPYTGKRGSYCWFRDIRTTVERRENAFIEHDDDCAEVGVKVRGSRLLNELPSSYDDIHRSVERSWKRNRLTQYRD